MKTYAQDFSVERMAAILEVSRSGYYSFMKAALSSREQEHTRLLEKIRMIYEESHKTYGSPRIHAEDLMVKCALAGALRV